MKKLSSALLLSAFLAIPVHAKVVTFRYTADVSSLNVHQNGKSQFIDSETIGGYTFSLGDRFTGTLSYDTDMPPASVQPWWAPPYGTLVEYQGDVAMTLQDVQNGYAYVSDASTHPGVSVGNDSGSFAGFLFDSINVYSSKTSADGSQQSFGMYLTDYYGKAFNSSALPTDIDVKAFLSRVLDLTYTDSNNTTMYAAAQMMSVDRVDAADTVDVPAPATLSLFALGSAGLFGTIRRRR